MRNFRDYFLRFQLLVFLSLALPWAFARALPNRCLQIFSPSRPVTYKSVLRAIVGFEKARSNNSKLGSEILSDIEAQISQLNFDDLFNLFRPESGLRPFFIHDPFMRKAIGHGLFHHAGDRISRAEFIRKLLYEEIDFEFYDELLGVDRFTLEVEERYAMDHATSAEQRKDLHMLGLGFKHDNWFSNPHELMQTLKSARKLGVKSVVDLGSGAGRLGLLLGVLYPEMSFIGLDIYEPRIRAAQQAAERWGFGERVQFRTQDLLDSNREIPDADFYYMFGPTKDAELNSKILNRLKMKSEKLPIFVQSRQETTLALLLAADWLHRIVSQSISDSQIFTNRAWLDWYSILNPKPK